MHTVFALLCFVVVMHRLIFPYPSGFLHWHCGNLTIAPVPSKQPWWIWINTSCEFIMNDCITTTKQSTTDRVHISWDILYLQTYTKVWHFGDNLIANCHWYIHHKKVTWRLNHIRNWLLDPSLTKSDWRLLIRSGDIQFMYSAKNIASNSLKPIQCYWRALHYWITGKLNRIVQRREQISVASIRHRL